MTGRSDRRFARGRGVRFAMVPHWVGDALPPVHRANGIALYAVMMRFADHETAEAWPSRERLADDIGKSVETIKRTVSALVEVGAIERLDQRVSSSGSWLSRRYLVHFDPPPVGAPPPTAVGHG